MHDLIDDLKYITGGIAVGVLIVLAILVLADTAKADEQPVAHNKAVMDVTVIDPATLDILGSATRLFPTMDACKDAAPKVYAAMRGSIPPQDEILVTCAAPVRRTDEPVPPSTSL